MANPKLFTAKEEAELNKFIKEITREVITEDASYEDYLDSFNEDCEPF